MPPGGTYGPLLLQQDVPANQTPSGCMQCTNMHVGVAPFVGIQYIRTAVNVGLVVSFEIFQMLLGLLLIVFPGSSVSGCNILNCRIQVHSLVNFILLFVKKGKGTKLSY